MLNDQRRWQGTGLGLAVVHDIVKNHEGAVLIEGEPKKETMITVYLPSVDEATMHEANF